MTNLRDKVVGELNRHTHTLSQAKVEMVKLKNSIKQRTGNTAVLPQNILVEELGATSAKGSASLPRLDHFKITFRMQRKDNDHPKNPIYQVVLLSLLSLYVTNKQQSAQGF